MNLDGKDTERVEKTTAGGSIGRVAKLPGGYDKIDVARVTGMLLVLDCGWHLYRCQREARRKVNEDNGIVMCTEADDTKKGGIWYTQWKTWEDVSTVYSKDGWG